MGDIVQTPWHYRCTRPKRGCGPRVLLQAHCNRGFTARADVISIGKHAATEQALPLAAEERVNQGTERFLLANKLTPEQMQWLSHVRERPVRNLPMDGQDFDLTPRLETRGDKAKARRPVEMLTPPSSPATTPQGQCQSLIPASWW